MTDRRVFVVGMRASGDGYPNAENTIRLLRQGLADVVDFGVPFPEGLHLWQLGRLPWVKRLFIASRVVFVSLSSIAHAIKRGRGEHDWMYVPYPAIPCMLLVSLIPRQIRPRCIVDGYISIWDSAFSDRGRTGRLVDWLVKALEGRALRAAYTVLVDTQANADHFAGHFRIPPGRLKSIPLAIRSKPFLALRNRQAVQGVIRVCFVGTLIPLHGVQVILRAARLLSSREDVKFVLIGDGQMAHLVKEEVEFGTPNIEWRPKWLSLDSLAEAMGDSHICLGVFGGVRKAARVLPFKLYYALAGGLPIISQDMLSTPAGAPVPPILPVESARSEEAAAFSLAARIVELAESKEARARLGEASAEYFDRFLSDEIVMARWRNLLEDI